MKRHGLGFRYLELLSLGQGRRVRLNYWPSVEGSEDIHNHRWDFTSVVLLGSFTEEVFDRQPGGDFDVYQCLYGQHKTEDIPSLGTCSMKRGRITVRRAVQVYRGHAGQFHRVTILRAPVLTLFIKHKRQPEIHGVAARPRNRVL
jgi:hypothetical protein